MLDYCGHRAWLVLGLDARFGEYSAWTPGLGLGEHFLNGCVRVPFFLLMLTFFFITLLDPSFCMIDMIFLMYHANKCDKTRGSRSLQYIFLESDS